MTSPLPRPRLAQRGFTLVELMVASAIGLVILSGITALFISNTTAQNEVEQSGRQIENGRYATQLLTGDLRNAGYYGAFDIAPLVASPAPVPALPDLCAPTIDGMAATLPLPVQGFDNVDAGILSACLTDVRAGTDIIVARHTSSCALGDANCPAANTGGPFFQASLCNGANELGSSDVNNYFVFALDSSDTALSRKDHTCNAVAPIRRFETHIYFIANNDNTGDGIPTLKRAELSVSNNALGMTVVPMVEGVEDMQFEYGTGDGNFFDAPTTAVGWSVVPVLPVPPSTVIPPSIAIRAIKLTLLARNTTASAGYTNTNTYTMGNKTVTINGDHYKRHLFQSTIYLANRLP
ncbi:MAG: PilW family protein [Pseudomonadota bacterium]